MKQDALIVFIAGTQLSLSAKAHKQLKKRLTNATRKNEAVFTMEDGTLIFPDKIAYILPAIEDEPALEEEECEVPMESDEGVVPDKIIQPTCSDNHDSRLPIAFTTTSQGIKRYHYYCSECGWKSTLIKYADLPEDTGNFINLME
jgi:hypothetical protein